MRAAAQRGCQPVGESSVMLLEEQHHRAQMTLLLRLGGAEPPPYPGQAWVELGVDQE